MNSTLRAFLRRAAVVAAVALAALSLASGQTETFTIKAKSTAGGTISPAGVIVVPAGGSQSFTMTPNEGYNITRVVADKVDVGPVTTWTFENVLRNTSIKATFKIKSFTVTFSAADGCSISPSGTKVLKWGKQASITVAPPKGSSATPILTVDGQPVTLTPSGSTYKYTLIVSGPHVLVASLAPRPTLTVSMDGTGSGSVSSTPAGIVCGAICSAQFDQGSMVTLTPSASPGSTFTGWSGACTGSGACQVQMNADATVTATFTISAVPQHTLTVSKSGNGTGSVSSNPAGITCGGVCDGLFNEGTQITLTAQADAGSSFTGWSGGGCSGTGDCQVTLNADTMVTASFAVTAVQRTLTVGKAGTGTGLVTSNPAGISCGATCDHPFDDGSSITLTAAADAGSTFAGWSGSGCSGTGNCQVNLNADKSVTATFNQSGGGGGLTLHVVNVCGAAASGAIVVVHNANGSIQQKFTTPANGIVDLSSFGDPVTFTVGWPNAMGIPDAEIQSFVEVPASVGTFTVALEGGTCTPTDPKIGSVTVNLTPEPVFSIVDPLGFWQPTFKVLDVYQSDLQNDGKLSLLAPDNTSGADPVGYGFLLDQTYTNGAQYTVNIDKTSTAVGFSAADPISSVLLTGARKGVAYTMGPYLTLQSPVLSGDVQFYSQFPASSFSVTASANFLVDGVGTPYSTTSWIRELAGAPASINIPALFHVPDFTFDSGAALTSWTLSSNTAGKLGLVGFSNVQSEPLDDRRWTIALDPTTHSNWAESNLTLPPELDLTGRTVQGPSLSAYAYSYVTTYANALKSTYGAGVTPPAPPYDLEFTYRTIP